MAENRLEEVLARRLDQALPPDRTSLPPVTPDPLVNIAARIASMSVAEPSDIALARIEAKMLAAFDRQHVAPKQQRCQPRRWTEYAARWAVAASLILVFLIIGALPASAGSLPGEPLYPVKRLVEQVELALASSPNAAALLRLQHAERRALETLTLLERGQLDESLLAEAVSGLDDARQAASTEFAQSLAFQWQQQQVSSLIEFASDRAEAHQPETAPQVDVVAPSETPTPTQTATPTLTSTATASQTPTDNATVSPTRTPRRTPTEESSPEGTSSARPTRTPRRTPPTAPSQPPTAVSIRRPTATPVIVPPTRAPVQPTDCPGNSCYSAGVPGGQIDPNAPPGQSGGRSENPPDPPGRGEPGGGQNNNPGQGNSGNQGNTGNGQYNNPGNGNSNNSGGSAPTAPPPPPDSSGNSGNQGNTGNGQNNNSGNNAAPLGEPPPPPDSNGNSGNQGNIGNGQENAGNGGNNPNGNGGDCPGNSCNSNGAAGNSKLATKAVFLRSILRA